MHHSRPASERLRGSAGVYEDLFFLTSGTKRQISAYASTDPGGTGSAALWVTDHDKAQVLDGFRVVDDGQWQRFTFDFTVSSNNKMRIQLMSQSGTVCWHSVTVTAW